MAVVPRKVAAAGQGFTSKGTGMSHGRVGDLVTGAAGTAAGTAVDPKQGLRQLRGQMVAPALVAFGVLLGYLLGRRLHR
ncbi:hypothetical protein ACN27G_09130 [Plantactinospora sp. WMMB334]|uniref:hypothetical protein n=1 Tax=Plantactinospora sp. WMMB334 TaxID=3404119 RepID=UPI003B952FDE